MSFTLHPDLLRDSHPVDHLPLCEVRLVEDAAYPWVLLVPRVSDISDTIDLNPRDHAQMWEESRNLSQVLMQLFEGDKLNVAALGNMTPQLHLHHIVRYHSDPAWPGPIWGKQPMAPYSHVERESRITRIRDALQ
jgi:diadenosine tetraphosphate (Ap4A) HIT family hydrolase